MFIVYHNILFWIFGIFLYQPRHTTAQKPFNYYKALSNCVYSTDKIKTNQNIKILVKLGIIISLKLVQ